MTRTRTDLARTELRHRVLAHLSVGRRYTGSIRSQVARATNSLYEAGLIAWMPKSVQPDDGTQLEPTTTGYVTLSRWDAKHGTRTDAT